MNAEFRCVRNDDGTCKAEVTVEGKQIGGAWRVQSGTPADLERLYLNFVVEHKVCPTIQQPCHECLPLDFIAKLQELGEWSEGEPDSTSQ
ncbi:MAG TPA: hypothetical protein VJ783_05860 [Pirellulales bacterium]|nr:hypothetical protein [Pirellulales bacterium]